MKVPASEGWRAQRRHREQRAGRRAGQTGGRGEGPRPLKRLSAQVARDMPSPAPTRPHLIDFPPFQLDLREGILRREAAPVTLRPKTFAVLRHLAEHPGELVSKQALLDAVWGDVAVTEEVVRLSIFELRAALCDDRAT